MSRLIHLQVKIASLAAEQQIIRKKEIKWTKIARNASEPNRPNADNVRTTLYEHRTKDVRLEVRAANLALAFLTGKPYVKVEKKITLTSFHGYSHVTLWQRVTKIVQSFGPNGRFADIGKITTDVLDWRNQHPQYVDGGFGCGAYLVARNKKYGRVKKVKKEQGHAAAIAKEVN